MTQALLITLLLAEADTFFLGSGRDGPLAPTGDIIVNHYAQVTDALSPGATHINVSHVRGFGPTGEPVTTFSAGELVLIVQMGGYERSITPGDQSDIDLTNSAVGTFELARINAALPAQLTLTKPLLHGFAAAVTQVVSVPEYTSLIIPDPLPPHQIGIGAVRWDGQNGAVVAFLVKGTIHFRSVVSVDAASTGRKGGRAHANGTAALCAVNDGAPPDFAEKGEALQTPLIHTGGANNFGPAGGGGNCGHGNGGGGGNAGRGGDGSGAGGGKGGAKLVAPAWSRLLAGAGGGAGQGLVGRRSEAAGGIVFVRAAEILGDQYSHFTAAANLKGNDGDGDNGSAGGSAGGTVMVRTATSFSCMRVSATGARPGTYGAIGTGGNGGGGFVLVQGSTAPACTTFSAAAGANGGSGEAGIVSILPYNAAELPAPMLDPVTVDSSRPTITGTGPAGRGVVVYLDGRILGKTGIGSDGHFTLTPSTSLPRGSHVITARADDYGMEGPESVGVHVVLQTCASDTECDSTLPRCSSASICRQCLDSVDCSASAAGTTCLPTSRCGCVSSADCGGEAALCVAGHCRAACVSNSECPTQMPVCTPAGVCAECSDATASSCPASKPFCSVTTGVCNACAVNTHCTGVVTGSLCIEGRTCGCGNDADCAVGQVCADATCVAGCRPDTPRCASGFRCANSGTCEAEAALAHEPRSQSAEPRYASRGCTQASEPATWVVLCVLQWLFVSARRRSIGGR